MEKKGNSMQERREKVERTDDKKTVRQSSVKSLTEKYIKSASKYYISRFLLTLSDSEILTITPS